MDSPSPDELLIQWERETLTVEMAIGHLLHYLSKMQTALEAGNITLYQLRADVDSLLVSSGLAAQLDQSASDDPLTKNSQNIHKSVTN